MRSIAKKESPVLAADAARTPKVTASRDGEAIVVRIEQVPAVQSPDALVAFPFGLERSAAARIVRNGTLAAARIGRRLYARRSDILALIEKLTPTPKAKHTGDAAADYAAIVTQSRGRR